MTCRACASSGLETVLDLGPMPLANALPASPDEPCERFPLVLAFCPACALLQITVTVPPERLFSDYVYFSSYSDTMLAHARALAHRLTDERGLGGRHTVLEIASNDGYLLRWYKERGVNVHGVEPAANVAAVARQSGIPTTVAFFGRDLAAQFGPCADVVHAHNVLAHVADLNGVVAGLATVLKPGGVAVVEVPYAREMIERRELDTIYHEHLCYFSLTALAPIFARHGLRVVDALQVAIHGGSLRLFLAHDGTPAPSVAEMLAAEQALGMDRPAYYRGFAAAAAALREELRALVFGLVAEGRRVAAYGAAAKGAILLNYVGLDRAHIAVVADRSPHKQGRYLPGVGIPIVAPEALQGEATRPDALLVLAWNFADEIMAQQAELARRGTRFIIPIPQVRLV